MKKNIYINVTGEKSHYINDIKNNFIYSKGFKYLKGYNQSNSDYIKLFDIGSVDEEEENNYYIAEASAIGYSQGDYQDFTFYFDKDILNDNEAMEELKYFLQGLKLYFTVSLFTFNGYIENVKKIKGQVYINKEELDYYSVINEDARLKEGQEKHFLEYNKIDASKYNIIYNKEKIIWL